MTGVKRILRAADEGQVEEIEMVLGEDPGLVNCRGDHDVTPLHAAAERNHVAAATALLDAGAGLEAETTWGMTPLQWAANMGAHEVGELLLARGARQNIWSAAGLGMLDAVKSFVAGPDTLAPGAAQTRYNQALDGSWETLPPSGDFREAVSDAFYVAARNGHVEVARCLLELGADIDFRGFFGGSGLHWAALNGHAEMVRFLLDNGADKSLKDEQFQTTPREWALEGNRGDIAELLG